MKLIRRILTISNLILAVALFLLYMSIREMSKAYGEKGKLISHTGVVQEKRMITIKNESEPDVKGDSLRTIKIRLENDETEYTICYSAFGVNTLVNIGDSVELFTIDPPAGGNLVIGDHGVSHSDNPNEVFQIFSKKYDAPVVDYKEYLSKVKTTLWVLPFLSAMFFAWYFFRRYNVRSLLSFHVGDKEVRIG